MVKKTDHSEWSISCDIDSMIKSKKEREYVLKNGWNLREMVITVAIIVGISYEEVQQFLKKNHMPVLYARNRRDTIIIWGIYHGKKIKEINEICRKYNCKTLYEEGQIFELFKLQKMDSEW